MIYVIFGTQDLMIKRRMNRIIKERLDCPDAFNYVQYDLSEVTIQELLDDAMLIPIGVEHKIVVGYNASFLSSEKVKGKILDNNYDKLVNYIQNPNEFCDVIFTCNGAKLDKKNKLVNLLLEKAQVYELVNPSKEDWLQFIEATVNKNQGNITFEAKQELYHRVGDNAYLVDNEINKLLLYDKDITLKNVEMLINLPLEENIFAILDSLMNKNNDRALRIYRDLLVKNEEPVRLIGVLASQLRTQADISALMNENYSQGEIAKALNIHEYRVQLGMNNARKMTTVSLLKELDNLYKLDVQIKESKINRFFGFEMFLLNFNKSK